MFFLVVVHDPISVSALDTGTRGHTTLWRTVRTQTPQLRLEWMNGLRVSLLVRPVCRLAAFLDEDQKTQGFADPASWLV